MSPPLASHRPARPTPRERPEPSFGRDSIIGTSRSLRRVIALARKIAPAPRIPVLLIGETGTGKELVARAIHNASPAGGEPFVPVNCSAIPEALLESELFGHERGAFTDAREQKRGLMELAGKGTLFLDEVGELGPKLQPKLLRVLEERRLRRVGGSDEIPIRCRIIAATNTRLEEAVARGEFREDLFYRLNGFRIDLPPLRSRGEDVELLARHFLERLAEEQGTSPKVLTPKAVLALQGHGWPGNIRELKNVVERAALLAEGERIEAKHLLIQQRTTRPASSEEGLAFAEIQIPPGGKSLQEIESEAIGLTLRLTGGNQAAAARVLGISRPRLARKLREYGLRARGARPA